MSMESLKLILSSLRDLLLPVLPRFLVKRLVGKVDFIFLVHPMDLPDIAKKYPFMAKVPRNHAKIFCRFLWPVIGPLISGYKTPRGEVAGRVIFCPMTTKMMLLKKDLAKKKLLRAARLGESLGVEMIGLGAFVPIVTDDGKFLADRVKTSLTTGTAYAAIIAVQNVLKIIEQTNLDVSKITFSIVGAGGSVGSICSKMLAPKFKSMQLVDRDKNSLDAVMKDMRERYSVLPKIETTNRVADINIADLVLVVTNVPGAVVKSHHLKSRAIVIDAGFPKNVSKKVFIERKDVLVIESGIAEVPGLDTDFDFELGIRKSDEAFSCLAEMLVLLWLDKKGKFAGPIDYDYVKMLFDNSEKAGIELARFRNELGYIPEGDIVRFKKSKEFINC